ncbi:hypothetical protein [Kribbella deserti]|uniref:Uncharacterized protein n=1 Tax=Kribbella deserti TaxID=1926257 RepID=A0ABV6QRM6_9ACTN
MYNDDPYDDAPLGPAHRGIPPGAHNDRRPAEAQRMGLSRHTQEGALIEFAAQLNATKPAHRFIAFLMLITFATPVLFTIYLLL